MAKIEASLRNCGMLTGRLQKLSALCQRKPEKPQSELFFFSSY